MTGSQVASVILFSIALALFNSVPFISGFITCVALGIALGDDDDPHGPHQPQPRKT